MALPLPLERIPEDDRSLPLHNLLFHGQIIIKSSGLCLPPHSSSDTHSLLPISFHPHDYLRHTMEIATGVISALLSLSQKSETIVNKFYQRKDLTKDNVDQFRRLQRRLARAIQLLPMVAPLVTHNFALTSTLQEFKETLQEDLDGLSLLEKQVDEAKVTDRVRRIKEVMDKYESDLNEFSEFLKSSTSPMLEQPTSECDRFIPRNTVPVNPPRLILDYTTTSTDEGKLKAAVLHPCEVRIVGVVASGKGGVGKTCALRGLADDNEIEENFPGGILYIQLGSDSKLEDITQGVARIVERTGGAKLGEKIRSAETLQEACDKASDWFHGQTCLFLVDDIWMVNNIDCDVLEVLASMVSKISRLVYTTRDKRFLDGAHRVIEFKHKAVLGELSRRMLMKHAGFDEVKVDELEDKNKVAFEAILRECKGHPLAFGIAGAAVLKKCRLKEVGRKQDAWSDFRNDIVLNPQKSGLLDSSAANYGPLTRIVDVSLNVLERNCERREYEKLFRALSVLRKQQHAPLGMLQKLWSLESLHETERVAGLLNDVSVVQMREEDGKTFVQLHDLILDIAADKASKKFETQNFFRTLITKYAVPGGSLRSAWWSIKDDGYIHNNVCRVLRSAGHNDDLLWLLSQPQWIAHRLLSAGIYNVEQDLEEGKSILSGSGWSELDHKEHLEIIGRAARLSCTFVRDNHREVWFQLHGRLLWHATKSKRTREFVEKIESCAVRPWVKSCEAGLLQQASLGALGMVRSNGEVLCTYVEEEELRFAWISGEGMGVTRYNLRTGSLKSLNFVLESILIDGNMPRVLYAAFTRDQNRVVSVLEDRRIVVWSRVTGRVEQVVECGSDGVGQELTHNSWWSRRLTRCFGRCESGNTEVDQPSPEVSVDEFWVSAAMSADGSRIVSGSRDGTLQLWDAENGATVCGPLRGHTSSVDCVAFSAEGSRIVSGSRDNTVRVWNTKNGEAVGEPLRGHTLRVECVTFSAEGSRIFSGSRDNTVRIWDAENGEAMGEPLRGHTEGVKCIALSRDGSRIVSGSKDNTVRVWDAKTGEAVGEPFRGHTSRVMCIAVSGDGFRIVSGSRDNTVRLWDAEVGEALGELHRGHSLWVRCLAVSADLSRIVSGSDDNTVRIWDAESGEAIGEPLRGHTDWVTSIAMNVDGSRILSGSRDNTVRVWDAKSGKAVGCVLRGHTEWIGCVTMSADGSRIVSGSEDNTVRVWNVKSGEAVGKPLCGHTNWVNCVAVSADGSRIVSGSDDNTVRMWDGESCKSVGEPLLGHTYGVECVALSADGLRILSGSRDCTVQVWDANTSQAVGAPLWHNSSVIHVGIDSECSRIVSEEEEGLGRLWDVRSGECVLTSDKPSWYSTFDALALSWSSSEWRFWPRKKQVIVRDEEGNRVVLATCEEEIRNVNGGDRYWPRRLYPTCKIIR